MCFSLQASAIASITLMIIGSLTVKNNYAYKTRFIAMIPFIFGLQQASEAIIWLQFFVPLSKAIIDIATYFFLICAYAIWPLWVPTALWYAESDINTKKKLLISIISGAAIASLLLYYLSMHKPHSTITCAHIVYTTHIKQYWYIPGSIAYLLATIAPWFITHFYRFWIMGIALIISYGLSLWLYLNALTSVWCFFAALLSGLLLIILDKNKPLITKKQ